MGNSNVKLHYETASKTGVLQLAEQKLKEVPAEAFHLRDVLRNLDLSKNKISSLPENIANFQLLKQFKIDSNRLENLPDVIVNLKKLEMLNASSNHISSLPRMFSNLSNLKQLYLNNNKFRHFPLQLIGLPNLDVVELSNNKIIEIPRGMSDFHAVELNLSQNEISKISEDTHLAPRLKILRLEENCLLIDAISPTLLRDSKLHTLNLEGNLFEPKQILSLEGYNEYTERYTAMKKKMF